MSVGEIKNVIAQLPPGELADLAQWLDEFQADAWDQQIAQHVQAGRFDTILKRVHEHTAFGQSNVL